VPGVALPHDGKCRRLQIGPASQTHVVPKRRAPVVLSRSRRPPISLGIEMLEAVDRASEGRFFSLKVLFPVFYPHARTHR
jgi:hypothetical protein